MADFHIKKGDRLPAIEAVLYDADGPFDELPSATSVTFKMKPQAGGGVISGTASTVAGTIGRVRYEWGASDTATAGVYNAEWVVLIGGKEMTFPADGFFTVEVEEDIS